MNPLYMKLKEHLGHDLVCVEYANGENLAIECESCGSVVVDVDRDFSESDVDTFVDAYIETALWSSTALGYIPERETEESDRSFEYHNFDADDIAEKSLKAMRDDCIAFMESAWDMIKDDLGQAGHDFWLTRCGHGAGFWDGDWDEFGDKLTELSKPFGNVDLYCGDDGKVYQMGSE